MDVRWINGCMVFAWAHPLDSAGYRYRGSYRIYRLPWLTCTVSTLCDGIFATASGARDAALDAGRAHARTIA